MELKRILCDIIVECITILLIVPYGIETHLDCSLILCGLTFNRTLWN